LRGASAPEALRSPPAQPSRQLTAGRCGKSDLCRNEARQIIARGQHRVPEHFSVGD